MTITTKLLISAAAAGLLATAPASAATFVGLYNTGVTATGTVQANGAAEQHYTVVGTDLRVATSANGFPIPPWVGDNTTSAWVGPVGSADLTGPVGNTTYRTTFTLVGPGTASISGLWSTDDSGVDILLNGVSTGITAGGFQSFYSFTINSGFVTGLNTLDFVINNGGGPTGLRTELVGTGSAVPEPATWAMMLAGFGMVGFGMRYRKGASAKVTYA